MIAMKDRENKSMIVAYKEVYAKVEARGQRPKLLILDNECSKYIQNYLEDKGTRRYHVALHAHRVNAAKPAVKTAKYHLIAALATLDWGCPVQLWGKMLKKFRTHSTYSEHQAMIQQKQLTKNWKASLTGMRRHWRRWAPKAVFYPPRQPLHVRAALRRRIYRGPRTAPLPSTRILNPNHQRIPPQRNLPSFSPTLPNAHDNRRRQGNKNSNRVVREYEKRDTSRSKRK